MYTELGAVLRRGHPQLVKGLQERGVRVRVAPEGPEHGHSVALDIAH